MTAQLPIARAEPLGADARAGWRAHLGALAAVAALILILFRRDAGDMAAIWWESSTFNHCLLIAPIVGWLVWQRVPDVARLSPRAWAPGLLVVAGGALCWLVGEAGGIAVARHLGLVVMLQGAVLAILGRSVSRGLAFPIFYALFLVPAGDEIVPLMQVVTAAMCMALLALVGIPAHIEGIFISIPTGLFEVAEACSGVKFLIAMIALGALVANLCFRAWRRRIAFMAAAVAIPVLANGVRAWGTIYISHLTSNDFAAGVDHVVYGWFFFAFVIALLLGAGWRFFDRAPSDPWFDPAALAGSAGTRAALAAAAAASLALAALPLAWTAAIASTSAAAPADIVLPAIPGWQRVAGARTDWQPRYAGADLVRMGRYRDAAGREVDLAIILFTRQEEGRELVGFGQGAAAPESDWVWTASGAAPEGSKLDRIAGLGKVREVATFYRVGTILTGSASQVKLETARTRLFGGPQRAVAVLVSAEAPADGASPRPAIDSFLASLGDVAALADRAAGLPRS